MARMVSLHRTSSNLDDQVDYFLYRISLSPTLTLEPCDLYEVPALDEEACFIDQVMIEKGLIKNDRGSRVITSKGLEIANFGGWSMYQKVLRKENQREFFESQNNLERLKQENRKLVDRVKMLESQVLERNKTEAASQLIVTGLLRQNRFDKWSFIISGLVLGVVLTLLAVVAFA